MENDKFWLAIWRAVIAGIVLFSAVVASCTSYSNALIASSIKGGADPIKAACAISSGTDRAICAAAAVK